MDNYLDDVEIITQFREESSRNFAFNQLVRKYQERVYWLARRIVIEHEDANDICQNSFIKIWKALENFKGEAQLFTWIYRIATNESLSFLKSKKNKAAFSFDDYVEILGNKLESDVYYDGDEIQKKLQKAILKLPEKQALVFNMKYFEELKYEEMSAILDTSVGALKASYHHAVKKIEDYLSTND